MGLNKIKRPHTIQERLISMKIEYNFKNLQLHIGLKRCV